MTKGPILIDLEGKEAAARPDSAPPVPDPEMPVPPEGRAMQTMATLAARRPSRLARLFWGLLLAILGAVISVAAWDFVTGLIARSPVLGYAITGLIAAFVVVLLVIALKELAAFSRLSRMDRLHRQAEEALGEEDLAKARAVVRDLNALYKGREDTRWGRDKLAELQRAINSMPLAFWVWPRRRFWPPWMPPPRVRSKPPPAKWQR